MAGEGLIFQFRYREMGCYSNVWTEDVLDDGALWPHPPNTYHPHIDVEGKGKGLLDINNPVYETATEMPRHDFSIQKTGQSVSQPRCVSMSFCLHFDGSSDRDRLGQEARAKARGVMAHHYPGSERE